MSKGKFTKRLRSAVEGLQNDRDLGLVECDGGSLFTPVCKKGRYVWAKVMDSDGLMVAVRPVHDGEGGAVERQVKLLLGVIVQSEDTTSQTKPNPVGKAAVAHIPNGVWVNVKGKGRRRLDRVLVVFVLPEGVAQKHRKNFATAKRNVENAAIFMPDAVALEAERGASSKDLQKALKKKVRRFFKGPGRPKR